MYLSSVFHKARKQYTSPQECPGISCTRMDTTKVKKRIPGHCEL